MSSLQVRITDLATRVATEIKSVKTLVNENAADLSALTTTQKTSLVAAINELKNAVDNAGSSMFLKNENDLLYCLSLYNTHITPLAIKAVSPTLNYQPGDIAKIPISFPKQESTKQAIDTITQECIDISKEEWDSREISWDFTENELLKHKSDSKIEFSVLDSSK